MRTAVSKVGTALALALGIAVMSGSIIGGIALAADRSPAVGDPSSVEQPGVEATSPAATDDDDATDDPTSRSATDDDSDDHATPTGTEDGEDHDSSSTRSGIDDPSAAPSSHDDHPEDDD